MAKGVVYPIAADTKGFAAAVKKGVIEPTEDAIEAIEDLGKAGADVDKVERAFEQAGRATEEYQREIKDVSRTVDRETRNWDRDISKAGNDGFSKSRVAAGEFKDEALSNFSEVTSSFDGSMSSIQDLAQGTLGGLATSGLPGVGLAAGAAATAVGLIGAAIGAADEQALRLQERAGELASAWIDAGSTVLDAATLAAKSSEILTDPEKSKEAEKLGEALGDQALAVRILAGDSSALAEAQTLAAAAEERLDEIGRTRLAGSSKRKGATAEEREAAIQLTEAVEREARAYEIAEGKLQTQSDTLVSYLNSVDGATVETDEFSNKLYTLPDGKQILIDAETGQATTNVETFKGDVDGIKQEVTTTVRVVRDSSDWDNWQPPDKTAYIVGVPSRPGRVAW